MAVSTAVRRGSSRKGRYRRATPISRSNLAVSTKLAKPRRKDRMEMVPRRMVPAPMAVRRRKARAEKWNLPNRFRKRISAGFRYLAR